MSNFENPPTVFPRWPILLLIACILFAFGVGHFQYGSVWWGIPILLGEIAVAAAGVGLERLWRYFFPN